MKEKDLKVEIVGQLDLSKLNNTFYQILFESIYNLHKQQEKSNA